MAAHDAIPHEIIPPGTTLYRSDVRTGEVAVIHAMGALSGRASHAPRSQARVSDPSRGEPRALSPPAHETPNRGLRAGGDRAGRSGTGRSARTRRPLARADRHAASIRRSRWAGVTRALSRISAGRHRDDRRLGGSRSIPPRMARPTGVLAGRVSPVHRGGPATKQEVSWAGPAENYKDHSPVVARSSSTSARSSPRA
jgi:hypothetical protein